MNNNVKQLGQVFTPRNIVVDILNLMNYEGEKILNKHIIDNSCGDGAFLKVIVERYIDAYKKKHGSLVGIEKDLEVYIHGIEIDYKTYESCVSNLKEIASRFNINDVKWNIVYGDAIEDCSFDYKMDYVVGNPPYVRVHNLGNNFNKIRDYKFCKKGMTDLYILFYEIGFKMLNPNGTLCYITPNSFYSSNAGRVFRQFIFDEKCLVKVIDLGHYQPFKVSTYTTICMFVNNANNEKFKYYKYDLNGKYYFQENLQLKNSFVNGKLILAKSEEQKWYADIQNYIPQCKNSIQVKNGFATLADKIFVLNDKIENSIKVLKASTGKWYHCLFPYDKNANIIDFDSLSLETQKYLNTHKEKLKKRCLEKKSKWYGFGRSQAIRDVFKDKIAINTTIKDIDSIKLNMVKKGEGIYSGLYIVSDYNLQQIKEKLLSREFIRYLEILNKCKNGGYFTFSTDDLKKYLIFKMEKANE